MFEPSFEQLQVFVAVAKQGSLAAAARALGKAPSAITSTMQQLELAAGIALCDRSQYRATLTAAGSELLPRAEQILRETRAWHRQARSMAEGIEPSLSIVIDALYPVPNIVAALTAFRERFPSVALMLGVETSARATQLVLGGQAAFGILVDYRPADDVTQVAPLENIQLIAVCCPSFPLSKFRRPIKQIDVHDELQIIFGDGRNGFPDWGERGVLSLRVWRTIDIATKRRLILEGIGWGSLPRHLVEEDIETGRLCALQFNEWNTHLKVPSLAASLVQLKNTLLGPAGTWLRDTLVSQLLISTEK